MWFADTPAKTFLLIGLQPCPQIAPAITESTQKLGFEGLTSSRSSEIFGRLTVGKKLTIVFQNAKGEPAVSENLENQGYQLQELKSRK